MMGLMSIFTTCLMSISPLSSHPEGVRAKLVKQMFGVKEKSQWIVQFSSFKDRSSPGNGNLRIFVKIMLKLLATTTKKNQGSNGFLRNTPAASSTSLFSWQDNKKHKVNEWVNRVCDFDKKLRIHLQMSHSALLLLPNNFQIVTERFFSPDFDHITVCETTEKFKICASLGLIK